MTKMAAMPIYGKNPLKIFFSETGRPISYFMARSTLVTYAFLWEKVKTVDFSETIAACDLKVGRCRQLIEIMKVCEY